MTTELQAAELDVNQLTGLDAEGTALRNAAEKAGAFGPREMMTEESAQEESEPRAPDTADDAQESEETKQADNSDAGSEEKPGEDKPRDEHGRFVAKDAKSQADTEKAAEGVEGDKLASETDSAYSKAKKEQERQKSVLANFEEQKRKDRAEIAAERAQLERERQQLHQQMQVRQNGQRPKDAYGNEILPSGEYLKAVRDFRGKAAAAYKAFKDGNADSVLGPNGEDWLAMADHAEQVAGYAQQLEVNQQQQQLAERQNALAVEVLKGEPELQNPESPLAKTLSRVFENEAARAQEAGRQSLFKILPDGFALAVEYAKTLQQAESASELKAKNKELEAEVKRLREATSIGGSSPVKRVGPKSLGDISNMDELSRALRDAAEREDAMLNLN